LHFSNYAYIQHLKRVLPRGARIADICTGPGTIGLALMAECELQQVSLIDINPRAVQMCRQNAASHFADEERVRIFESDVFLDVPSSVKWDWIVGNPPHNLDPAGLRGRMQMELYVQAHDPNLAFHRRFFVEALEHIDVGGRICLLENGDQDCITASLIEELLRELPQYRINEWHFLPASQFYVIDVMRVQ
jgi:methylase of polypeptide subunit release factors